MYKISPTIKQGFAPFRIYALFFLFSSHCLGQSIGINFGSNRPGANLTATASAGVIPQTNWNNAGGSSGNINNLTENSGTTTNTDLTWNSDEEWSFEDPNSPDANGTLMTGWISANNNSSPSTIQISSIPYPSYNLYIYFNHDRENEDVLISETSTAFPNFLARENDTAVNAPVTFTRQSTSAAINPAASGNYALFEGLTNSTLNFSLTAAGSAGTIDRGAITGIQIVAVTQLPETENTNTSSISSTSATLGGNLINNGTGATNATLTFYWGTTDGGTTTTAWDSSLSGGSRTSPGNFSATLNSLTPGQTYFYRTFAANDSGDDWAPNSATFTTLPNLPNVSNNQASNIFSTSATIGGTVTDTGGEIPTLILYYGDNDAGTSAGNWDNQLDLGTQSGSANSQISNLNPNTTYYFRAATTNSAGTFWATASSSFQTSILSLPVVSISSASSINSAFATLNGTVTNTGGDPPTVTLFYGTTDGIQNPANWDAMVSDGAVNGDFSILAANLSPSTTYYFTARATNLAGSTWASFSLNFTTPVFVTPSVVINEIHYDENDKTQRAEFIELHNPSNFATDLSNYAFTDGIDYTFPSGTTLPAGGYLVIVEDPATAIAKFGLTDPLGPFANGTSLRNSGETITLSDPSGNTVDTVDYSLGFPWPTVGNSLSGPNDLSLVSPSIELINPLLDNDLGGSWRASGFPVAQGNSGSNHSPVVLVASQSSWRYRKGFTLPENDSSGQTWQANGYFDTDDGQWLTGNTSIGYRDGDDMTILDDMQGNYISIFARKEFTIAPGEIPSAIRLRCYHDDGAVVYLNGIEVERFSVDEGPIPFPAPSNFANDHEADWSEVTIAGVAAFLTEGTNVIAIHGINNALGSSDFSLDAEVITAENPVGATFAPTPGRANSSFALSSPPQIRQVNHSPEQPTSNQAITITTKITDPDVVESVSLQYQIVEPGDYFCRFLRFNNDGSPNFDPRYEDPAEWTSIPMTDDGNNGDALAADSIYTAILPPSLQENRRLIRYRITASDSLENAITVPYSDDEQPNFAYFVYDGTPDWTGQIRPGDTPVTYPGSLMSSVPTYFLLSTSTWVNDSQLEGYSGSEYLWPGSMVYEGIVYDHIQYRPRGGVHRFSYGKNFWKFNFHRGHRFQARDNYGRRYNTEWDKLNFSSIVQQVGFNHRGEQGLLEGAGFRFFQLTEVEACNTHYTQFYVVDDANAEGTTQYNSDYYGLFLAIEQMDSRYLREHDLPDGNLYKIENHIGDSNNQGASQVTNNSDVSTFISTYRNGNPSAQWWRDNLDLDKYFSYRAIVEGIHHYDIAEGKNYFYYHNPETGKFEVHPWDLDLTWADNMFGTGNHDFKTQVAQNPAFNTDYQNRVREIMDLLYNNDEGDMVIDELIKNVYTPGQPSLVGADRRLWDNNPLITQPDRYYDIANDNEFSGMIKITKDYITDRGNWMINNLLTNESNIPETPLITQSGSTLTFNSSPYDSPNGTSFNAMEWRLSEILNPSVTAYVPTEPFRYEIENPFESGEITSFSSNYTFPLISARPGRTYRVRVRHRDSAGRWSHWSEPAQFVAQAPDVSLYQNALVISEIMFNPPSPSGSELNVSTENDDYEFIEIQNTSNQTIDLTGVRFTKGIDFDFADGTLLEAGAFILVVKNIAAFEARYGPGLPVAGSYGSDNLSNGGELIKLSLGAGTSILEFLYDDSSPWPESADGAGSSLTLALPDTLPNHAFATSWRASFFTNGTPGEADDQTAYQLWATNNGVTGRPDDDDDRDGISNILEFALVGDPRSADGSILPTIDINGPSFTYTRPTNISGIIYNVEFSTDLENWDDQNSSLQSSTPSPDGTTIEVWQYTPTPGENFQKLFSRLRITTQ